MGGRGGGSGMKRSAGGGGQLTKSQAEIYEKYSQYVDKNEAKIQKREQSLRRQAESQIEMYANTRFDATLLNQIDRQKFAEIEMRKARTEAVKDALKDKRNLTDAKMAAIETQAARDFAKSKVAIPKSYTGKADSVYPRNVDMREFFSPNGNPYNYTQHGGITSKIRKDWGESVVKNFKKHNGIS